MDTHSIGEVRCPAFSWGMHSRSRVAAQFRPEVVEERSSTVEMLSNALMFAGMATVAAGAGMARGCAEGMAAEFYSGWVSEGVRSKFRT